jgi:LacI family transcriptional regulator
MPHAVFAANDEMATGAVQALRERGLNVPGDVAVVGFDDIPLAAHMLPTLTTVRQPLQEFGRIAVRRLTGQIAHESNSAETIVLPAPLVLRQSCGCEAKDSSKEVIEEQS